MGFPGGKITEIAFNVTNKSSTAPYNNFNIKMGCTATNNFNGATQFEAGLVQVLSNPSYTSVVGWNTHTLDNAYEWDGNSNLIVEVCFDNANWTNSDDVAQTATAQSLTLREFQDGAPNGGCGLNGTGFSFSEELNRPNIRITHCATTPDPSQYLYAWSPSAGLSDDTIKNPIATPVASTDYIVTVSDSSGQCSDNDTISVTINITATATADSVDVSCFDGNDGKLLVEVNGVGGPYTVEYFDTLGTLLQTNNTAQFDSLTNLTTGTYMVKVTDFTGCPIWDTLSINQPTKVLINNLVNDTTL